MKILAIETSCDETAAAVVENGRRVLSNVIASQIERHVVFGGVVPEIASRMHSEAISGVVSSALSEAGEALSGMDAVAVTSSPGLIGALLVGVNYAKGLSFAAGLPLVPVHHLRAHIAANYITFPGLEPPFLCLVVSGGHSHIVEVLDYTKFRIIGKTRDDAAGEAMDKTARALGLPYPGGVNLDKISKNGDPSEFKLPRPRVDGSKYDFSFSGLKTAAVNIIHKANQKGEEINAANLGAAFIEAVNLCLCQNIELAAEEFGHKKIVLAGGVSANSRLRSGMKKMCKKRGFELFMPELSLCGDNAAMVGSQAFFEFNSGNVAGMNLNARASSAIDMPE